MNKMNTRYRSSSSTNGTDLKAQLESIIFSSGGDFFGVADLEPASGFIIEQGGDELKQFPRGVSIGIRLSDHIVDHHSEDETHQESQYWHHVYRVVTPELDRLAWRIQGELQAEGHRAYPVPGSMPYNRKILKSVFPHKLAAHLSGLGWIGKSCLLVTPDFGPRVRFVTVLTDAPLPPDKPFERNCGKCTACIDACPVQALKGIEFDPVDPVEIRFDTFTCEKYRRDHPCGLCVSTCPFGQPGKKA
jgi:epoxyqueuosine reductase